MKKVVHKPLFGPKWGSKVVNKTTHLLNPPPVQVRVAEALPVKGKFVTGFAPKHDPNKYTGDKMIGIGVVHKSGLQPVFSQEQAEDLAKMRR